MELSSELIEIGPEKKRNAFVECLAKAWTACALVRNALRFKK